MCVTGLLKDSLRKYWLEEIRRMEADKTKAYNKTPRELADLETVRLVVHHIYIVMPVLCFK